MAIDTAERRFSAAHNGKPWGAPGVTSNVLKEGEWRAEVCRLYAGLSYTGLTEIVELTSSRLLQVDLVSERDVQVDLVSSRLPTVALTTERGIP